MILHDASKLVISPGLTTLFDLCCLTNFEEQAGRLKFAQPALYAQRCFLLVRPA